MKTIRVITKESLLIAQREDLQRVMDLLTLDEQHARSLLIYYHWDIEKVLAVLVEKGKDRLFSEAGVTVVEHKSSSLSTSAVMCYICMDDIPANDITTMDCGHGFCNNCWTEHFIVKINEGQSRRIRCMAHKCNAICDEAVIRNLVSAKHPDLAERFERFLLESYIEDNKMVKWCPSVPHCGNAIRVEGDKFCEVECACGLQFCFSCSEEAHSPCSCLMWELWTKKCQDESKTVSWMAVNTMPCPKCDKPVEKNGGCNFVSCICGQAFCWLCGGATGPDHTWSSINGHSCGRYKDDNAKRVEHAKHDLHRYMHYYNRYKVHTDSFKLETMLKEIIQDKISISESKQPTLKDFSWVTNGLNRLFRCRRVLSYSYPFAYYMFGDILFKDEMSKEEREIKQHLFENQQQQLEANVEKLSEFIEEPFDEYLEGKIMEIRMQVIDLSVITDSLCKKMYECIENDLLGSPQFAIHNIAPYRSKGVERATELSGCWNTKADYADNHTPSDSGINRTGGRIELGRPFPGTPNLDEIGCSRKRARKQALGDDLFDLNLPAEVIDKS
ncbi:PREDICTED: probable E3 ubiquitin-protein ligase ARI1 isoform X1 [Nelumbo nucifera]|uniref:RBR-type E3 ubiquitin transferase n=1 Tax=Nelumbo nucifera TaxID=4432 RepID=A0A1U7YSR3_NELNU|nr:PREDICTED: probable E3 ubiquitin-protein ligase ARI1 isoform X1 [Nelumbo nucifera]